MTDAEAPASTPEVRDDRLRYLDGYRAVAALAVVFFHVGAASKWASTPTTLGLDPGAWRLRLGNYGVAIFFLLSGLVLYRPFAAASLDRSPGPSVRRYLGRRLVRIFPAYLAALTAFYVLGLTSVRNITGREYVMQYLLLLNYDDRGFLISMGVSWTLCIEVAFYLVLPLLALAIRRLPGGGSRALGDRVATQLGGLGLLVLAAWAYRIFTLRVRPDLPGTAPMYLPAYLDWFALGMLLAVLLEARRHGIGLPTWFQTLADSTSCCWLLGVLVYWLSVQLDISGAFFQDGGKTLARFPLNGVSALFLLLPAVLGRRENHALRVLDARPLVFLGTISYGIYLWHPIVLRIAEKADVTFTTVSLLLFVLATAIPIAYVSLRFVERPAMDAERRYERRQRAGHTVVVAPA